MKSKLAREGWMACAAGQWEEAGLATVVRWGSDANTTREGC